MPGTRSRLAVTTHLCAFALVVLWSIPTFGLLVSSFRDRDQISASGWWRAMFPAENSIQYRAAQPEIARIKYGRYIIEDNIFNGIGGEVLAFGTSIRSPDEYAVGSHVIAQGGEAVTVAANGDFAITSAIPMEGPRGMRIFATAVTPAKFTFGNYGRVIGAEGLGRAFFNTLTVSIPATVIPILIAAFAAYALAWMAFPGRALIVAAVVGLMVVPLQMAFIPLLTFHNQIGIGKSYLGVWLAHTGFGLPLAIYLLRNYMVTLPKEIIENARIDGATDFQIFLRIVLPLTLPALAGFAIFQFLWTWNDLLVALVFLGSSADQLVLTGKLKSMMGSHGGEWEILAASAFVTMAVPLLVFFAMQKYLVRGLLAGSLK
ncbi:carbohydrate ABC transporter permease (plasmid) [Pseudorhodobacter turbinis]|uniref:Carbohydrate ABC transporter permease n=1 Tax=Pseudorhodobacter turbinis TaxID=2500533 RepID=A0A4P8EJ25_9RHOB|nr:carbohydrate ABC transporter permease [Pseudorhodobacter turbinis]QCO56842.1 carbohydrate ABC transporter permease [Pseudorhodobacter turbinis]